jgi:hypothetical protein
MALFLLLAIPFVQNRNCRKTSLFFAFLAAFAFVISMGFMDKLLYNIPLLNRFRYPIRNSLFLEFFIICLAAQSLHMIREKYPYSFNPKNILSLSIILVQLLNFCLLYMISPRRNFNIYSDKMPFQEPHAGAMANGRIFSIGDTAYLKPDIRLRAYMLGTNLATSVGLYHFAGANPMLPLANSEAVGHLNWNSVVDISTRKLSEIIPYLRVWGVKWYVVDTLTAHNYKDLFLKQGITSPFCDHNRYIFYDGKARPFVFWNNTEREDGIQHSETSNSIIINALARDADYMIVNFIHNPFFKAYVDGKRVPLAKTNEKQMAVFLARGSHLVIFKYQDPYFVFGLILCGITLSACIFRICPRLWPLT